MKNSVFNNPKTNFASHPDNFLAERHVFFLAATRARYSNKKYHNLKKDRDLQLNVKKKPKNRK
jgi:hypothetical protein